MNENISENSPQEILIPQESFKQRMVHAMQEFKNLRSICTTAMLTALNVALHFTTVFVSSSLRIGVTTLTIGVAGLLFGPWITGAVGVVADLIKYVMRPDGPYFFGFAINEFLIGVIYGIAFYGKKITAVRTFSARAIHTVLINLILTPIWLNIMYNAPFWATFIPRLLKNLALLPIEFALLFLVLKLMERCCVQIPFLKNKIVK